MEVSEVFWQIAGTLSVFTPRPEQQPACEWLLQQHFIGQFHYGKTSGYHLAPFGYRTLQQFFGRDYPDEDAALDAQGRPPLEEFLRNASQQPH